MTGSIGCVYSGHVVRKDEAQTLALTRELRFLEKSRHTQVPECHKMAAIDKEAISQGFQIII